jgi:hypothetical protein
VTRRSTLLKQRRAKQGRGEGPGVRCLLKERTGREGGGVPTGGGQRGWRGNGPAVVWPRRAPDRTGEGEGGLTGGLWPQCRAVALVDRRARAAQCRAA